MAALKEPVKIFIVQSLACRDTPQEVAELVKQEFKSHTWQEKCPSKKQMLIFTFDSFCF